MIARGVEYLKPVAAEDIPIYPYDDDDRMNGHYFMAWERRRWLNSDMRLSGEPECRAYYFDLLNISFDQSPIGTLPNDMAVLARLCMVEQARFENLCKLPFGPLHKWQRVQCGDDVRLGHPFVIKVIAEAVARKHDHQARSDASSTAKRLLRLRTTIAGYHADLAKNDAALLWIDGWLTREGCEYRSSHWIERAMAAWAEHSFTLVSGQRRG